MINEFIEFLLVPFLPIMMQVVLICLNIHVLKESNEKGNEMFQPVQIILWLILTILIFPTFWGMVWSITSNYTCVLISLCLMLCQVLINVGYLFENEKQKRGKRYV